MSPDVSEGMIDSHTNILAAGSKAFKVRIIESMENNASEA